MAPGIERLLLLTYCLSSCWPGFSAVSNLRVVQQWAELEFKFPTPKAEQRARQNRFYVPGKSVPIDVDVNYRKPSPRIFVTIPRFGEGRPVTLGTVDNQGRISGYPNYAWNDNQGLNCDGLTSVFRVAIDECNRLWVMDAGKIGDAQVCPPQLLAFDLNNDQLIFKLVINASSYIPTSRFLTPVVDVQDPCDCANTFVYVADGSGFGILVVDVANRRSWWVTHRYCFPYPSRGRFTIAGVIFDLMDGVFGMALSPSYCGEEYRYLYFHALASTTENIINTQVLRNESYIRNPDLDPYSVYVFSGERPNQSAAEAMDRDGILYFGINDPPSILCWNTATEFSQRNFHQLAEDKETLQFASGVKVVNNLKGEQELWVLTCSLQRVWTGSLSSDQINFRIHTEKISELVANSSCRKPPKGPGPRYFKNYKAKMGKTHGPSRYVNV